MSIEDASPEAACEQPARQPDEIMQAVRGMRLHLDCDTISTPNPRPLHFNVGLDRAPHVREDKRMQVNIAIGGGVQRRVRHPEDAKGIQASVSKQAYASERKQARVSKQAYARTRKQESASKQAQAHKRTQASVRKQA